MKFLIVSKLATLLNQQSQFRVMYPFHCNAKADKPIKMACPSRELNLGMFSEDQNANSSTAAA